MGTKEITAPMHAMRASDQSLLTPYSTVEMPDISPQGFVTSDVHHNSKLNIREREKEKEKEKENETEKEKGKKTQNVAVSQSCICLL